MNCFDIIILSKNDGVNCETKLRQMSPEKMTYLKSVMFLLQN